MPKQKIAIISDIHVGPQSRAPELRGNGDASPSIAFITQFEKFVSSNNISVDSLIIAGDLTSSATPQEFSIASELILSISKHLSLDKDDIYFVPGNHDLNWPVCNLSRDGNGNPTHNINEKFWINQRFNPIKDQDLIFADRLSKADKDLFRHPFYCIWNTTKLMVLAINSAAYDFPWNKPHNGEITQDILSTLDNQLSKYQTNKKQLRLALIHHHPILFPVSAYGTN